MILKNVQIVTPNEIITNGWLELKDDKIIKIGKNYTLTNGIDLTGLIIMPGFIDCHTHGGFGVDFEKGSKELYSKFAKLIASEGVTKFCLGSVTNSDSDNEKYLQVFAKFMDENSNTDEATSKCLGLYLEGPFISHEKKGAHEASLLQKPSIDKFSKFVELSNNTIRMVAYACENQDGSFTKYLKSKNIIACIGHSNATAELAERDYDLGARQVTHLFNGMSGVDHKKSGLATLALLKNDILCEIIADLVHLDKYTLQLIYKLKGHAGICIITDGSAPTGLVDGNYKLGNLDVVKHGITMRLLDGTLAASAATYDNNVRVMKNVLKDISLIQLSHMTSINIAKQLNIFNKTGSIEIGKLADLTILDDKLNVKITISEGKVAYCHNSYINKFK